MKSRSRIVNKVFFNFFDLWKDLHCDAAKKRCIMWHHRLVARAQSTQDFIGKHSIKKQQLFDTQTDITACAIFLIQRSRHRDKLENARKCYTEKFERSSSRKWCMAKKAMLSASLDMRSNSWARVGYEMVDNQWMKRVVTEQFYIQQARMK